MGLLYSMSEYCVDEMALAVYEGFAMDAGAGS